MNTPYIPGLVSIILPVYNVAPYLPRAVDSVLRQTCPHWELLMIDDGSTDGSSQICADYARRDPRIHAEHTSHSGVSHARNCGLTMARGEWIFFLDSDDWLSECALETLLSHAADADVVMASYPERPASAQVISEPKRFDLCHLSTAEKSELYFLRLFQTVWNKLYRHDRINVRFQQDLCYGEDTVFNFSLFPSLRSAVILPDQTYHYNTRSDSLTHQIRADRMQQVQLCFDLFDTHFSDCPSVMDAVSGWYVAELYRYLYSCAQVPDLPPQLSRLMIEAWLDDPAFQPDRVHAQALPEASAKLWTCICQKDITGLLQLLNHPSSNATTQTEGISS